VVGVIVAIGLVKWIIVFTRRRDEKKKAVDEAFILEVDDDDPDGIYYDYRY
jgi:hypothetical protein